MAGRFVAVVGALAIVLSAAGLALDAVRPGPLDITLDPSDVPVQATGSYQAVAAQPGPLGACVVEPCAARTRITLQLQGLPQLGYTARLEGAGTQEDLGAFAWRDGAHVLAVDRAEDHTDKQRLVLLLAGLPLHAWAVGPGERSLDGLVQASLGLPPVTVHVEEIGAVTVSTTSKAQTQVAPPPGFAFVARLHPNGSSAFTQLGTFEPGAGGAYVLDGRVERLRMGEAATIAVVLQAGDDPTAALPAWDASY